MLTNHIWELGRYLIINSCIGHMGRLGNQMWQVAFLLGIAHKHNYEWGIPSCGHDLFNTFAMPFTKKCDENFPVILKESTHIFEPQWLQDCPDNIEIQGYWQNYKYWYDFQQEISTEFDFLPEVLQPAVDYFQSLPNQVSSLHVRRGDYVNGNWHIKNMDYYTQALAILPKDHAVLVVSDDIAWCKNQSVFASDRFIFYTSNNAAIDMAVISLCANHIIANSSFSWWAAWLSKSHDKIVIAPTPWISLYPDYYKDMTFPSWITLNQV